MMTSRSTNFVTIREILLGVSMKRIEQESIGSVKHITSTKLAKLKIYNIVKISTYCSVWTPIRMYQDSLIFFVKTGFFPFCILCKNKRFIFCCKKLEFFFYLFCKNRFYISLTYWNVVSCYQPLFNHLWARIIFCMIYPKMFAQLQAFNVRNCKLCQ